MRRKITHIEDLTPDEQNAVINSMHDIPCIPVTLRYIKENFAPLINIDFSEVKEKDLDRKVGLTMNQAVYILTRDYESLRALSLLISNKIIYAKSHEANVIDKDHMDMELDEFRERCKMESEEQKRLKDSEVKEWQT